MQAGRASGGTVKAHDALVRLAQRRALRRVRRRGLVGQESARKLLAVGLFGQHQVAHLRTCSADVSHVGISGVEPRSSTLAASAVTNEHCPNIAEPAPRQSRFCLASGVRIRSSARASGTPAQRHR